MKNGAIEVERTDHRAKTAAIDATIGARRKRAGVKRKTGEKRKTGDRNETSETTEASVLNALNVATDHPAAISHPETEQKSLVDPKKASNPKTAVDEAARNHSNLEASSLKCNTKSSRTLCLWRHHLRSRALSWALSTRSQSHGLSLLRASTPRFSPCSRNSSK